MKTQKNFLELVDEIPAVYNTPEIRIECDDREKFEIIEKVVKNQKIADKDFIDIDGIRVNDKGGWWLLRASNTQPSNSCKGVNLLQLKAYSKRKC